MATTAMWLTIIAPLVSQAMVMDASPSMAVDSMDMDMNMPMDMSMGMGMGMGAHCGDHTHHATSPNAPAPHGHPADPCGYCTLISDSPTLGSAMWQPVILPPALIMPAMVRAIAAFPPSVLLAAAPRGPPVFVSA